MTPPPLPDELLATLSPAVRADIRALEAIATQVARLTARVAELEHRPGQTSANSSKPPSSDGRQGQGLPARAPRSDRPFLHPDAVVEFRPAACPDCQHTLAGDNPEPLTHQVVELPPDHTLPSTAAWRAFTAAASNRLNSRQASPEATARAASPQACCRFATIPKPLQ